MRRTIQLQRALAAGGRIALMASRNKVAWVAGTVMLAAAKIIENMELGHNITHGQWDWMNDPEIHSTEWEWDTTFSERAVEEVAQFCASQIHQHRRDGRRRGLRTAPRHPRPRWDKWNIGNPGLQSAARNTFRVGSCVHGVELSKVRRRREYPRTRSAGTCA